MLASALKGNPHENARQIKLNLESDVDVCAIYRWAPPESETTVGDLVKTGTLGISEFFERHRPKKHS